MAKTIWYFADGEWKAVATLDDLIAGGGGGGGALEVTNGTLHVTPTTKISTGTGITLTNPATGEAHLVASGGGGGGGISFDVTNTGGYLDIETTSSIYFFSEDYFEIDTDSGQTFYIFAGGDISWNAHGEIDFWASGTGNGVYIFSDNDTVDIEAQTELYLSGNTIFMDAFSGMNVEIGSSSSAELRINGSAEFHILDTTGFTHTFQAIGGNILLPSLPTSDPAVSGALWNNSGVLNISP